MTRVLCYSPYGRWTQHAVWEMTILHGLRLRGADVRYVLCDGLYPECDAYQAAIDPRPIDACAQCQAQVRHVTAALHHQPEWLGRWVRPEERAEATRWAAGLSAKEMPAAVCGAWPLGEWMLSSVRTHFRMSHLDLARPEIREGYRAYLEGGLVACFGLTRLLDDLRPDVLLQFNGRMASTRVALELARRRDIRVVCHERGLRPESLRLDQDVNCLALEPTRQVWRDWGGVPLQWAELERVRALLDRREHGQDLSWSPFSPPPEAPAAVLACLGLDAARPLWVAFTSSDDEVISEPEWRGPFPGQLAWLERTVAWAGRHPEIDLVVRVHPNTGGRRSHGRNEQQLAELEALAARLPANCRMVMPDDPVSSYTLMDLAAVGLVFQSSVGLELACKGKRTILAAGSSVSGLPFVDTVTRAAGYERLLDHALGTKPLAVSREIQRLALRFAHALYFRWNVEFPLVKMADAGVVRIAFTSTADLAPGRDAALDRVARIVLDGEPVCVPPTLAELCAPEADELAWLARGVEIAPASALDFAAAGVTGRV